MYENSTQHMLYNTQQWQHIYIKAQFALCIKKLNFAPNVYHIKPLCQYISASGISYVCFTYCIVVTLVQIPPKSYLLLVEFGQEHKGGHHTLNDDTVWAYSWCSSYELAASAPGSWQCWTSWPRLRPSPQESASRKKYDDIASDSESPPVQEWIYISDVLEPTPVINPVSLPG